MFPSSSPLSKIPESPNLYGQISYKVSFNENLRRQYGGSSRDGDKEEVAACSLNKSFRRESELMSMRSKSRLMDPSEAERKYRRILKPGYLGKGSEIDDDSFLDEDFSQEFKKMKFIVVTGAKSEQDSKLATRRFAMLIQKLGFPAKFKDFRIHCDVDFPGLAYSDGDDLSSHLSRVLKL